jgi:hypothetical protein
MIDQPHLTNPRTIIFQLMKYTTLAFLMLLLCQSAFSQSKKEQIETLILQKDSLVKVLEKERQLNTDQVKQLETKISKINSDMRLIQKELAQSKKDLAAKENEIKGYMENHLLWEDTIRILREELNQIKAYKNDGPIIGLSEEKAELKMREFLLENIKKYKNYGEVETLSLFGGNYTNDKVQDYFYSVGFFAGGDFVRTIHFFYDSEKDKIIELAFNYDTISLYILGIDHINEGKIIGQVLLWNAFSGEHISERILNIEFTIKGAMIVIDEKYHSRLKTAEKEISDELKKMQKDLYKN